MQKQPLRTFFKIAVHKKQAKNPLKIHIEKFIFI